MLRSMLWLGRDEHGHPTKGIDLVPECKSRFVQLLKEQSGGLQAEPDSWAKHYHKLYQDYSLTV